MLLLFSKLPKLMMNVIIKIDDHHRLNESIGWNYEPATRRMLDGRNSFAQTVLHNKQFSLSITKQFCTTSRVRFVSWTMIWTGTYYIQLGVDVFNTRMHICISKRRYCTEYRIYEIAWMHSIPCLYIYIYNDMYMWYFIIYTYAMHYIYNMQYITIAVSIFWNASLSENTLCLVRSHGH